MIKQPLISIPAFVLAALMLTPAQALKTDATQPATLDADEFDMDFQTGVRTYRGNVVYQQGTIRLYADEVVAYFRDGNLQRAVARGNRAEFRQRPDDSETDVVGLALRIELNQETQIVTLTDRAKVTQDLNTLTGKKIVYNMKTERVKVNSGPRKTNPARATTAPPAEGSKTTDSKAEETQSSRPRIVIQPRK